MKALKKICTIGLAIMMGVVFMPMIPGVNGKASAVEAEQNACFIDTNKNGKIDDDEIQYESIQEAILDIPAYTEGEENQEETIVLLRDCTENIGTSNGHNIVLDLNDHMLSCKDKNSPVIYNCGDLTIKGAGDTQGSTIHKWVPNNNPEDDIPDGLWVMNDEATGTEGIDYFVTKGGVITGSNDSGIKLSMSSLTLQNTNIIGNAGDIDNDINKGQGGGIHCLNYVNKDKLPVQIIGGRISGNVSTYTGGVGGVNANVSGDKGCEITLSGNAVIDENKGALADNLAINPGNGDIVLDNPAEGMKVGISCIKDGVCTSGVFAKNRIKGEVKYFFSDSDCYMVTEESGNLVLSSRINQQPAQNNNYTVGIDMTGLPYQNLSYQWSKQVKNISCTDDMFEKTIDFFGWKISCFNYNADKNNYSAVEFSEAILMIFQPKQEYAENMDTVSFKVDSEIKDLFNCPNFEPSTLMEPDKDGYYTMDIGNIPLLGTKGCIVMAYDANQKPQSFTISDLTYSGWSAVKGQTKSQLTVTEAGTYKCLVTFKDGSTVSSEDVSFNAAEKPAKLAKTAFITQGTSYKKSVVYSWNAVDGAASYKVYQVKCGKKKYKKVKTTSATTFTKKNLKRKTTYKAYVVAYNVAGQAIDQTPIIHNRTKGGSRSNATAVGVAANATIKVGATTNVGAAITAKDSKKKLLWKNHVSAPIRYYTADSAVATVDENGNVYGVAAGTANIYSVAPTGVHAVTKVIVRKAE